MNCTKGMNYCSSKDFNLLKIWYIAYNIKEWKKVFEEFKEQAETIDSTIISIPSTDAECLKIGRI